MRKIITRSAAAIAVAMATAASLSAQAITLQTGESAVFNFDFTGQTPAPPYTGQVTAGFSFANVDLGTDQLRLEAFGDLGATGTSVFTQTYSFFPVSIEEFFAPGLTELLDGVYSVRLSADHGPFDVTGSVAKAFKQELGSPFATITGTLATSIPEPAALALLGGGMLAVAAFRRRRP